MKKPFVTQNAEAVLDPQENKEIYMDQEKIKEALAAKNFKIIDEGSIKIVYVVICNTTLVKFVNGKQNKDEYTQILRVCETEDNAHAYVKTLKPAMNRSYYVIPTPYGDVDLPKPGVVEEDAENVENE